MKNFMDFMKHDYKTYYVQLENGECVESTREECFAPSYDKNQRWYWDNEQRTIAVRLYPDEKGKAIGNVHASSIRAEERYWEGRMKCVWKGVPGCDRDCSHCDTCGLIDADACMDCDKKCEECTLDHVSQTIEMDMFWESDNEDNTPLFELIADEDTYIECENKAKMEALDDVLAELTNGERELWGYLVKGLNEREIASIFGFSTHESIRKRKAKLFSKLRENGGLKNFYSKN